MARCLKHRRDTITECIWCGKALCKFCIAKQEGRKSYCAGCATQLAHTGAAKIPKVNVKNKALDDDGYFDFTAIK
jgi:hypothetical protein